MCKSLNTAMASASLMETLRGGRGWMPLLFNHLSSTHKVPYELAAMVRRLHYLNRSSLAPFCFSGWREGGGLHVAKTDHESSMRWPRRARM